MSSVTLRRTLVALPRARTAVEASLPTDAGTSNDGKGLTLDPDEFGIPASLTGEPVDDSRFRIPEELAQLVESALEAAVLPEVLWLQLVEPFGSSRPGAVGATACGPVRHQGRAAALTHAPRPSPAARQPSGYGPGHGSQILVGRPANWSPPCTAQRLPPHPAFDRRRTGGDQQEPPPDRVDRFDARDVDRLVRAVLRGSPRTRTTVDVITTPWIYYDLKALWRSREWSPAWPVCLHDPYQLR